MIIIIMLWISAKLNRQRFVIVLCAFPLKKKHKFVLLYFQLSRAYMILLQYVTVVPLSIHDLHFRNWTGQQYDYNCYKLLIQSYRYTILRTDRILIASQWARTGLHRDDSICDHIIFDIFHQVLVFHFIYYRSYCIYKCS